jgi:hypothetical protein
MARCTPYLFKKKHVDEGLGLGVREGGLTHSAQDVAVLGRLRALRLRGSNVNFRLRGSNDDFLLLRLRHIAAARHFLDWLRVERKAISFSSFFT